MSDKFSDSENSSEASREGIGVINVNGIQTSRGEMSRYLLQYRPALVAVSETLLSPDQYQLSGNKFRGYRWIHGKYYRRGFAFLLREDISCDVLWEAEQAEALWISVRLPSQEKDLKIGGVYNGPKEVKALEFIDDVISNRLSIDDNFVVAGDLNARALLWDKKFNAVGRKLLTLLPIWGATVVNTHTQTCIRHNGSSNPDLIITNVPRLFSKINFSPDMNSDHRGLHATVAGTKRREEEVRFIRVWQYTKADWKAFRSWIDERLSSTANLEVLERLKSNRVWKGDIPEFLQAEASKLSCIILEAAQQFIPMRETPLAPSSGPYWYDKEFVQALAKKEKCWLRYVSTRGKSCRARAWRRYQLLNNRVRKLENYKRTASWKNFADAFQDEKNLFALFKRSLGGSTIPSFKRANGDVCATDSEKAAGFNHDYAEVGNSPYTWVPFHDSVNRETERLRLAWSMFGWDDGHADVISVEKMKGVIKGLNKGKAPGHDGIRNEFLKELSLESLSYMSRLFSLLLSAGICPEIWKRAILYPVPKAGRIPLQALDLRPIALVSCVGKLYERLFTDAFYKWVHQTSIIPEVQTGFIKGKGTMGHLARLGTRLRSLGKFNSRVGIFLDVKKAYNSVWHNGVIRKLEELRAPLTFKRWISSWLSDRTYITRIGSKVSQPRAHARGIPQGCVLSPILFVVFFSDVISETINESMLFADDITLVSASFSRSPKVIQRRLQHDLDVLHDWAVKWQMEFEPTKTKLVWFSRQTHLRREMDLRLAGIPILRFQQAKCLGVVFDEKITFAQEAAAVLSRFSKSVSLISRLGAYSWGCPPDLLIRLYLSVARTKLLYNPWSLFLAPKRYLTQASQLQCRFLKRILSIPRCAGGDVAEVYCAVTPIQLLLKETCAKFSSRFLNSHDTLVQSEFELYLNIIGSTNQFSLKTSTYRTPFGVLARSANELGLPLRMYSKRVPLFPSPRLQCCDNVIFPNFKVHMSSYHEEKARCYGLDKIETARGDGRVCSFVDGSHKGGPVASYSVSWLGVNLQPTVRVIRGPWVSAYSAELRAIKRAVCLAAALPQLRNKQITIFSDCKAAVLAVLNHANKSATARGIHDLLLALPNVTLDWIPAHVGISYNEDADQLACQALQCDDTPLDHDKPDLTDWTKVIKKAAYNCWAEWWREERSLSHLFCFFPRPPTRRHHIFGVDTARIMARLRTGYSSDKTFLLRHHLVDSSVCPHCFAMLEKTITDNADHFFLSCPRNSRHRILLADELAQMALQYSKLDDVLAPDLPLHKQIRIANALSSFVACTTPLCFY